MLLWQTSKRLSKPDGDYPLKYVQTIALEYDTYADALKAQADGRKITSDWSDPVDLFDIEDPLVAHWERQLARGEKPDLSLTKVPTT